MHPSTHLGVPEQLHHTPLIGGESSDLPDDRSNELGLGRLHALALAGAGGSGDGGGGESLVDARSEVYNRESEVQHAARVERRYDDALVRAIFAGVLTEGVDSVFTTLITAARASFRSRASGG